jgi:aminoglycoside phosphotransferase (APT) family kinase protein
MQAAEARRARAAAITTASELGLAVDDVVVLNDSNRLVARLLPCDIVARVSPIGWFSAAREIELARRLADETDAPVAGLDRRVEPRLHERDGFEIAMWTYFEPVHSAELAPADYADALERLHSALRQVDVNAPHFTDRLAEIRRWLANPDVTPELTDEDRQLLAERITNPRPLFLDGGAAEQLLHGEPHPWNVLVTNDGPLFIDFENGARGPVEFDLAWVPSAVSERYRDADQDLIAEYRGIVLALIAAHRWRRDDQHPSGRQSGIAFLNVLREGPPWPALDAV